VKTGTAQLQPDQINRYLDWARENRLDGVLTISNQITGSPTDSPVPVDGRKLKNTKLYHLSSGCRTPWGRWSYRQISGRRR
jgi:hypothetical protein